MIKLEFDTAAELHDFLRLSQPTIMEMETIIKRSHRERDALQNRLDIAQDQAQAAMACDDVDVKQLDMISSMAARIEYLEIQMMQVIDPTGCNVCTDAECEPEPPKLRPVDLTPVQQEIAQCSAAIMQAATEQGYFVDEDDIVVLKHDTNRCVYYLVLLAKAFAVPKKLRSVETESEIEFAVEFSVNSLVSSTLRSCTISTSVSSIAVRTGIKSQMDNLVYIVTEESYSHVDGERHFKSTSGIDNINESLTLLNEVDV